MQVLGLAPSFFLLALKTSEPRGRESLTMAGDDPFISILNARACTLHHHGLCPILCVLQNIARRNYWMMTSVRVAQQKHGNPSFHNLLIFQTPWDHELQPMSGVVRTLNSQLLEIGFRHFRQRAKRKKVHSSLFRNI